ncbi:MAG: hypothetical protein EXS39_07665 [Opitutaceae bacterium]|nr:hypothetical protein [Opitutaceae bacterium]
MARISGVHRTFTGDGVPSHLLTREAMALYMGRLAARDGLLVIHASTRYSRFFPVVDATARSLQRSAIDVVTDISESAPARDWGPTHTEYLIVCRPEHLKAVSAWFPEEEENGRVKHKVTISQSPLINSKLVWSDERNATIDVLELGKFLFEP